MSDENNNPETDDLAQKIAEAQKKAEAEKAQNNGNNDENSAQAGNGSDEELSEVEKLKLELEKMTELAKRTMADMQNQKRRQAEERQELLTVGSASLMKSFLAPLDNLDRAHEHLPKNPEDYSKEWFDKWYEGVKISLDQIHKGCEEAGLEVVGQVGEKFDPDFHEALLQGPGEKDSVIEVLEKGYKLGKRVIRHAKVKVGTG